MKTYNINIIWDEEAAVWVAVSDDIPLALEGGSYDALIERVKAVAPEILELNNSTCANFRFVTERVVAYG